MFAGIITFFAQMFGEFSASASKHAFKERLFSYTVYGFLSHIVAVLFFLVMIFVTNEDFVYNTKALPLFFIRLIAEVIQCEIVYRAFVKADRTTFGFARILTIPLLLVVDIMLGYSISNAQFLGIGIIAASLLAYFGVEHLKAKGSHLALISAVLSVLTISIYKFDVSNYNTPAVIQLLSSSALSLIYGVRVLLSKKDRSLFAKLKGHPMLGFVFASEAIASTMLSYAYTLAPASLILSLSRASAVVWSLLSGVFYFHEKKVLKKVFFCAVLAIGLVVMVV
jgi:hypothetical protein